jgi:hypothetical protein
MEAETLRTGQSPDRYPGEPMWQSQKGPFVQAASDWDFSKGSAIARIPREIVSIVSMAVRI